MSVSSRLAAYGLVLGVVFTAAFVAGSFLGSGAPTVDVSRHDTQTAAALPLASPGYVLRDLEAPAVPRTVDDLAFTITRTDGTPVTEFETTGDKDIHVAVVRADGAHFHQLQPQMASDGRWSLPWRWEEAGTYRVFVDVTPSGVSRPITLSTTVQVAGMFTPTIPGSEIRRSESSEFVVEIDGNLVAGQASTVTATVTRDDHVAPILESHLGAYGHLAVMRLGDLSYSHAHPDGNASASNGQGGRTLTFQVPASTPGLHFLYLEFRVGGKTHTARFVLNATTDDTATDTDQERHGHGG